MKKKLLKISLILTSIFANAQIVYTNINPDTEIVMSSTDASVDNLKSIDFNNDGVEEYNFRYDVINMGSTTDWFMHIQAYGNNNIAFKGTQVNQFNGRFIQHVTPQTTINATSFSWGTSIPEPFIGESTMDTNFLDLGDRYIPVRFKLGANTHYGWILVNFATFGTTRKLIIKSYAYNSTPDAAIGAGQLANDEISKTNFIKIYPNPAREFLNVNLKFENIKNANYQILNLAGQSILNGDLKLENNKINISGLKKGVYFIQVNQNDKTSKEKFIVD